MIIPKVCGITSISLDHTEILGDTVEKIAVEKAGIIKEGVPTYTFEQKPSVLEILRKEADKKNSNLDITAESEIEANSLATTSSHSVKSASLGDMPNRSRM